MTKQTDKIKSIVISTETHGGKEIGAMWRIGGHKLMYQLPTILNVAIHG